MTTASRTKAELLHPAKTFLSRASELVCRRVGSLSSSNGVTERFVLEVWGGTLARRVVIKGPVVVPSTSRRTRQAASSASSAQIHVGFVPEPPISTQKNHLSLHSLFTRQQLALKPEMNTLAFSSAALALAPSRVKNLATWRSRALRAVSQAAVFSSSCVDWFLSDAVLPTSCRRRRCCHCCCCPQVVGDCMTTNRNASRVCRGALLRARRMDGGTGKEAGGGCMSCKEPQDGRMS